MWVTNTSDMERGWKFDFSMIQRKGNYSSTWRHTPWTNWSLWIHWTLQGSRSSSPAEQRSLSALLSWKISKGTEPLHWDKRAKITWPWSHVGCSVTALGKERIPPALALWHHHTNTSSKTQNYTLLWRTCAVLSYRTQKKPCVKSPLPFDFRKGTSKPKGTFSYLLHRKSLNEHPLAGDQTLLWWQGQQECVSEWWQGTAVWGWGAHT